MATETRDFVNQTFKQATDSFTKTMQAGIKFQEEAAQFWTQALTRGTDDFRGQWDKVAHDALPFGRKNVERFHKLFEDQSNRTLELFRKSVEFGPAQNVNEVYEKAAATWKSSLDTMRQSAEAFAKANSELFESWNDLFRASAGGSGNGHVPVKSAK